MVHAQDVHAFARRQFETGKYVNATIRCGVPERWYTARVVVIGDGEHRYADRGSLVDDGLRVGCGIAASTLPAEGRAVVVRVHLEGAAMKDSARRKRLCFGDRILGSHSFPPYGCESSATRIR